MTTGWGRRVVRADLAAVETARREDVEEEEGMAEVVAARVAEPRSERVACWRMPLTVVTIPVVFILATKTVGLKARLMVVDEV